MNKVLFFPVSIVISCAILLTSCGGPAASTSRGAKSTQGGSTEITFFDTKATMMADDLTLDFFPGDQKVLSDPKDDGNQFVRVGITFKNTGDKPFKMNYTNITLDNSKEKGGMLTFMLNKSNVSDLLGSKELAKGESVSGALYFEVPKADMAKDLTLSYKGYDGGDSKEYKVPLK